MAGDGGSTSLCFLHTVIHLVSGEEGPLAFINKVKQFPILLALTYFLHDRKCTVNKLVGAKVDEMLLCLDLRRF